ncbi:MAG TPA: DNA alkylation repair protein [Anaerolineae bacterium]|nr:DNA alkylation repair protein [Anaerolineae bacterium]
MDTQEILHELEKMGTAQNRKIYARHGVVDEMFGVSYANLGALKKKIKIDHALALELWNSGIHDARVLATMVADPQQMKGKTLDAWVKELNDSATTDAFAKLASQTALARKKAAQWTQSKQEYVSRAGWTILALLATNDPTLPATFFQPYLEQIAETIHARQNWTKEAMNNALIAIGTRDENLEHEALDIAARVGKVEVDHGLTFCKTPDAAHYIARTIEKRGYAMQRVAK